MSGKPRATKPPSWKHDYSLMNFTSALMNFASAKRRRRRRRKK